MLSSSSHGLKFVVVRYSPNEGIGEKRERFWNDTDRTMEKVGNGYRLCMLGDLNGWIGDRVRADNWFFWSSRR